MVTGSAHQNLMSWSAHHRAATTELKAGIRRGRTLMSRCRTMTGVYWLGQHHRDHRVDKAGSVTLRHNSRLHHIGIGRTYAGTCVIPLVQDLQIRVVHAATGELLRDQILDPNRDYQPTGAPKRPTQRPPK
jgi:hypothetical protein